MLRSLQMARLFDITMFTQISGRIKPLTRACTNLLNTIVIQLMKPACSRLFEKKNVQEIIS